MNISPTIRRAIYSAAPNYSSLDAYLSDLLPSSIWGEDEEAIMSTDRVAYLTRAYEDVHSTFPELLARHTLSQAAFARMFAIPYRTVQDWYAGARKSPPYLIPLFAELLSGT